MYARLTILLTLCLTLFAAGCQTENPEVKTRLAENGFTEANATELSRMELTPEEIDQLISARKDSIGEVVLVEMVKSMHDKDLKFVIGEDTRLMANQGMGGTAMTQLVAMGAIPRIASDVRAMKEAGVSDVTIVEIAKIKFEEKKEILSGIEYSRMKRFGLSDSGLLTFVRNGGTAQQIDKVAQDLALGKPEAEALKGVGM